MDFGSFLTYGQSYCTGYNQNMAIKRCHNVRLLVCLSLECFTFVGYYAQMFVCHSANQHSCNLAAVHCKPVITETVNSSRLRNVDDSEKIQGVHEKIQGHNLLCDLCTVECTLKYLSIDSILGMYQKLQAVKICYYSTVRCAFQRWARFDAHFCTHCSLKQWMPYPETLIIICTVCIDYTSNLLKLTQLGKT